MSEYDPRKDPIKLPTSGPWYMGPSMHGWSDEEDDLSAIYAGNGTVVLDTQGHYGYGADLLFNSNQDKYVILASSELFDIVREFVTYGANLDGDELYDARKRAIGLLEKIMEKKL